MQLMEIADYFGVREQITRLETKDWDIVEETVKKVIKSSRAGTAMNAPPLDANGMVDGSSA